MADAEVTGVVLAAYAAIREAAPHVVKFVPRVLAKIAGRGANDASARLTNAQAREAEARADATASETWRAFADEMRAQHRQDRQEDAEECERKRKRDRAECMERETQLATELRNEFRAELHTVVRRLRPSPSNPDHAPLDPSITPIAGTRVDQDPTPDLHARPTPVPTDPPGRR